MWTRGGQELNKNYRLAHVDFMRPRDMCMNIEQGGQELRSLDAVLLGWSRLGTCPLIALLGPIIACLPTVLRE